MTINILSCSKRVGKMDRTILITSSKCKHKNSQLSTFELEFHKGNEEQER